MSEHNPPTTNLPCPFCGWAVDPEGWLGAMSDPDAPNGLGAETRGPECNNCGSTAPDMATWNRRTHASVVPR